MSQGYVEQFCTKRIQMFQVLIIFFNKKKTSLNIAWVGEGKIIADLILKLSTEYNSVFCTVAASNECSWNPEKVCSKFITSWCE